MMRTELSPRFSIDRLPAPSRSEQRQTGSRDVAQRPEELTRQRLAELANGSARVQQLKGLCALADAGTGPPQANGKGVAQLAVAPSYAAKRPREPGTAIPSADGRWKRPSWLRGEDNGMQTVLNDMIAAGKVQRSSDHPAYLRDNTTGTFVPLTGVSIDHIVDWTRFAQQQGVADLQELEESYHEMDNLQVAAGRTNSSNSNADVLHWMAGSSHGNYMGLMQNPQGQARLNVFFQDVVNTDPEMTMESIPQERRQEFMDHLGTIQNPRSGIATPANASSLLMAYAHARAMAGIDMSSVWEGPQPSEDDESATSE